MPVPIEEWSQAKVIAMGQEIFRQDTASWVATDALVAALGQAGIGEVRGWVVIPDGQNQRVRFFKPAANGVQAGWDVLVTDGRAGAVVPAADGTLSDEETARWNARLTAAANIGALRCSERLNAVVMRDPDSDGWLAWLLTSTTDANIIPMGGHYRFRISADGRTVLRRDQLTNTCLNLPKNQVPRGAQSVGLVVSQIVSAGPVETHVFLSLQNRIPIYVSAGDKMFAVEGASIRDASAALRR
ncbi:hypothetical protein [Brevundimonas sp. NIBR10]|uniref:hypothetical protein n=1 Tax=Brevundimonas sp. NIBR10 TaxID=3015997 RepID=UPI0022F196B0|nr:hypothetical protein [Brevundimonas sp. NIBR10]